MILSAPIAAQEHARQGEKDKAANLPAVIWRDPGDIATLNLFYGAGGKEHAPDPNGKYTFVKEDLKGHSPKFDVEDEQGVRWRVKLGQEPQAETAATRLLWAAGRKPGGDTIQCAPRVPSAEREAGELNVLHRRRKQPGEFEIDGRPLDGTDPFVRLEYAE